MYTSSHLHGKMAVSVDMEGEDMSAEWIKETKDAPFVGWFGIPQTESEKQKLAKLDQGYSRWATTRRMNPFVEEQGATGFEGYYIGLGMQPEEVSNAIAQVGFSTIESIQRMHRNDLSYMRKVWKVATGEQFNIDILAELNAHLLANTAKLRMQVLPHTNTEGASFRDMIATLVQGNHLEYVGENGVANKHVIALPARRVQQGAIVVNETSFSKDNLREGYRFMILLGKSGYPLVQMAIHKRS